MTRMKYNETYNEVLKQNMILLMNKSILGKLFISWRNQRGRDSVS